MFHGGHFVGHIGGEKGFSFGELTNSLVCLKRSMNGITVDNLVGTGVPSYLRRAIGLAC
jgi:hypothetical protein